MCSRSLVRVLSTDGWSNQTFVSHQALRCPCIPDSLYKHSKPVILWFLFCWKKGEIIKLYTRSVEFSQVIYRSPRIIILSDIFESKNSGLRTWMLDAKVGIKNAQYKYTAKYLITALKIPSGSKIKPGYCCAINYYSFPHVYVSR